ncbi:di-heme oxidoredictase family protein [Sinimarinibacterium flocculans]|uniref:CxxC motif-containing protein (DUF1111 family) n=1 Tax=Sinimarinibacterium flocculans TaxID=985250 RepID=A0A318ED70_9GAMM|nr:di-heme oxidoredictase family protein [Sinimarinibacterium flocculans]PXV65701.1 CxxC motif-containing protein (DUF1111 family) [Sinimarinibacterium flocculans]
MHRPRRLRDLLGACLAGALSVSAAAADPATVPFTDRRDPPSYRVLTAEERDRYELGQTVFNTSWVPAGTPRAGRRDGLGPMFNAASCDACHNNGARGQGPAQSGPAPVGLVIQLGAGDAADPVYGHVLNTSAIEGHAPEGTVFVAYTERRGRYPDGREWRLREPRYELRALRLGTIGKHSLIKPRLAPALFGAGLLEAVPDAAIIALAERPQNGVRGQVSRRDGLIGRFGWQADSVSLDEQTARALSREMGLTSRGAERDDCGGADAACQRAPDGGQPEVSDDFFDAMLAFQRWLAVPRTDVDEATEADGAALFARTGCAACHRPDLPVTGAGPVRRIAAYTDLLLHDLGPPLADRGADGRPVPTLWRTAPLWGLGHAVSSGRPLALLHDGRARSIEEAVLWHDGAAAPARQRFGRLSHAERNRLLDWVALR